MFRRTQKIVSIVILTAFISTSIKSPAFAQLVSVDPLPLMPAPGAMVQLSPEYTPAYLKGIVIHPENALKFDFIIYKGDRKLSDAQKKVEYAKLTKYFLASLAIPDDDQWVNLSPYEKDRIIKDDFGKTEMGRDLLAQDYMLKQITASLIYPKDDLGKKFWDRVYAKAQEEFGTSNIPVNTFNKVWIIPDNALIYEKDSTAYVIKNHLRVMLEEDYLSLEKHSAITSFSPPLVGGVRGGGYNIHNPLPNLPHKGEGIHDLGSRIIRQILLPALEREVNEGKNFAPLRQVYSGMLLAAWYKRALKESLLSKIYANKAKVKGVDQDPRTNEKIYHQYLTAYKKGVFNFIKEDMDKYTSETIPRKYFSGGTRAYPANEADFAQVVHIEHQMTSEQAMAAQDELQQDDDATIAVQEDIQSTAEAHVGPLSENVVNKFVHALDGRSIAQYTTGEDFRRILDSQDIILINEVRDENHLDQLLRAGKTILAFHGTMRDYLKPGIRLRQSATIRAPEGVDYKNINGLIASHKTAEALLEKARQLFAEKNGIEFPSRLRVAYLIGRIIPARAYGHVHLIALKLKKNLPKNRYAVKWANANIVTRLTIASLRQKTFEQYEKENMSKALSYWGQNWKDELLVDPEYVDMVSLKVVPKQSFITHIRELLQKRKKSTSNEAMMAEEIKKEVEQLPGDIKDVKVDIKQPQRPVIQFNVNEKQASSFDILLRQKALQSFGNEFYPKVTLSKRIRKDGRRNVSIELEPLRSDGRYLIYNGDQVEKWDVQIDPKSHVMTLDAAIKEAAVKEWEEKLARLHETNQKEEFTLLEDLIMRKFDTDFSFVPHVVFVKNVDGRYRVRITVHLDAIMPVDEVENRVKQLPGVLGDTVEVKIASQEIGLEMRANYVIKFKTALFEEQWVMNKGLTTHLEYPSPNSQMISYSQQPIDSHIRKANLGQSILRLFGEKFYPDIRTGKLSKGTMDVTINPRSWTDYTHYGVTKWEVQPEIDNRMRFRARLQEESVKAWQREADGRPLEAVIIEHFQSDFKPANPVYTLDKDPEGQYVLNIETHFDPAAEWEGDNYLGIRHGSWSKWGEHVFALADGFEYSEFYTYDLNHKTREMRIYHLPERILQSAQGHAELKVSNDELIVERANKVDMLDGGLVVTTDTQKILIKTDGVLTVSRDKMELYDFILNRDPLFFYRISNFQKESQLIMTNDHYSPGMSFDDQVFLILDSAENLLKEIEKSDHFKNREQSFVLMLGLLNKLEAAARSFYDLLGNGQEKQKGAVSDLHLFSKYFYWLADQQEITKFFYNNSEQVDAAMKAPKLLRNILNLLLSKSYKVDQYNRTELIDRIYKFLNLPFNLTDAHMGDFDEEGIKFNLSSHGLRVLYKDRSINISIQERDLPSIRGGDKDRQLDDILQRELGVVGADSAMKGGIDLNSAHLNLQIKRDGKGVPLPINQQDLENIHIDGLVPVILFIQPATNLPLFAELRNTAMGK